MDLRRLEYFVCIAEQGSLGRASEVLHVAQPALTRQVRLLEQELGATLFIRTRRGMRLTEEGEELLADIVSPLRELGGALQNLRSYSFGLSGNLAVGMTPTVAYYLARPLIERMDVAAPKVSLHVIEGSSIYLNEALARGELDVALLYEPSGDARFKCRELLTEEIMLVGAPGSLVPEHTMRVHELAKLPLILPNPKNGLRGITERYGKKWNVQFQIKHVLDSYQTLREMVGAGHGFTMVPLASVLRDVERGFLSYCRIENAPKRTLRSTLPAYSCLPRTVTELTKVIDGVLWELHDNRRIFGELRIGRQARP